MAECVHGEAISKLVRKGQPLALQEQLHVQALRHLSAAMSHASRAGEGALVLGAAQRLWLHCKPLADSGVAGGDGALLRELLGVASDALEALPAELMPRALKLRVRLYELLLGSLAEAGAWGDGLRLLQRAFASLPEAEHEPLWQQKVRFMCKGGGKGLAGEMHKLKDYEPAVQARLWAAVGGKGEQLGALLRAADTVAAEPLARIDHLVALACRDIEV